MCSRIFKASHPKKDVEDPTIKMAPTTQKRFSTCPNCGFKVESTSIIANIGRRGSLIFTRPKTGSSIFPVGTNPATLLDSSPTPQLLLSHNNIVIYANRSATRLLRRVTVVDDDPIVSPPPLSPPSRRITGGRSSRGSADSANTFTAPVHEMGLEGLLMEDLPIELARADMKKWITLDQVLKNVKYTMRKRHEQYAYGFDAGAYADYYETGKKDVDYYGDKETKKRARGEKSDDYSRKEMIPVIITKQDGELLSAFLYLSVIESRTLKSGDFLALSIVPNSDDVDAAFNPISRVATTRKQRAKNQTPDVPVGTTGVDIVERVAKLKDMILDEMEFSFSCMTPDGDIVITNKACRKLLGDESLRSPVGEGTDWIARLDIWRPDFSEPLPFEEWCINKVFATKKSVSSTVGLWKGDTKRIFDLKGTPLWENPEKKEVLLAGLTVIVEQTERESREREILRSGEVRKKFLMNLSKSLKAPIAGVAALLELLYEIQSGKEQRTLLRQMFRGVNDVLLVVNDLIDFNKIEADDLRSEQRTFDLQYLVEEVETLFRQSMAKENIEFLVDMTKVTTSAFGDGTRLLLEGDEAKIRRIIISLLSNAYKFTSQGTVTLRVITQKIQRRSLELRFEVKDTGIGISEEHMKRLFLPFQEIVSGDISTAHFGTGFGLTIAKSFTTLLRGKIGCESVPDEGSTFWFSLPCSRPSGDSEVVVPHKVDSLSHSMGVVVRIGDLQSAIKHDDMKKAKVSIEGINVLVVEDNWSHQVVMKRRLERMGCNVQVAVNGQNAISRMKRGELKADIVFMDLQMPLLDGFETTTMIRNAKEAGLVPYRDVPIVAVTATEMIGDRDRAREAGMNDFTLKPLHNDTLKQIMESLLDPEATVKDFREGYSMQSFAPRLRGAAAPVTSPNESQALNPMTTTATEGKSGKEAQ